MSCSICICEYEHGEELRLLPKCGHIFHTECIMPWLTQKKNACPLCQKEVPCGAVNSESNEGNEASVDASDSQNMLRNAQGVIENANGDTAIDLQSAVPESSLVRGSENSVQVDEEQGGQRTEGVRGQNE